MLVEHHALLNIGRCQMAISDLATLDWDAQDSRSTLCLHHFCWKTAESKDPHIEFEKSASSAGFFSSIAASRRMSLTLWMHQPYKRTG